MPTGQNKTMQQQHTWRRFQDGARGNGPWDQHIFKAGWSHKCPVYVQRTPPCQASCPSGEDIRGWLDIVRGLEKPPPGLGWEQYAFMRLTDANPFPAVMGRVCPAPCEDGCNRNQLEEHVGINAIEQFIGDIALEALESKFDAVLWAIGAQSGRALPIPGANASNCMTGVAFLEAFNAGRLQGVASKVVVVGGGDTSIDVASVARRLGHISHPPEKDRPETHHLGSTAHDVAAVAARQGSEVTLTSIFPLDRMQAAKREIEDALQEGVNLITGVMPLAVLADRSGKARSVRMAQCDVIEDRPVMRQGTEFEVSCELLVTAIGQSGNLEGIEIFDNGQELIDTDIHYRAKARVGHFAAGDILRPHLLTTAIGQGWLAAESIDHVLREHEPARRPKIAVHHFKLLDKLRETGLEPQPYDHQPTRGTFEAHFALHNFEDRSEHEVIPSTELFLAYFDELPRYQRQSVPITAEQVLGNFHERVLGFDETTAVSEAKRCMSCGMCIECDNCVIYCPQGAVKRTPRAEVTTGRYVYTDYARCIGCHICADVCPTGYIDMAMGE